MDASAGLKIFRAKTRSLIMMSLPDIVIVEGGTIFEGCMLLYTCKNARGFKTNIWYNNGSINVWVNLCYNICRVVYVPIKRFHNVAPRMVMLSQMIYVQIEPKHAKPFSDVQAFCQKWLL